MKLELFNEKPAFEEPFKRYVHEWKSVTGKPREDYYSMYKNILDDYQKELKLLVSARSNQRLLDNKPYVRFYWFMDDHNKIVGTIRYR